MKIEKTLLNHAVQVVSKLVSQTSALHLFRCVRVASFGTVARLGSSNGSEWAIVDVECEDGPESDFGVELKDVRELLRTEKGKVVELTGKKMEWIPMSEVPKEAVKVKLPDKFGSYLAAAAPVVDRNNVRRILQGINLSAKGIAATDGKHLLHIPCELPLPAPVTLPFPHVLLAAKPESEGTLWVWGNSDGMQFRIEIGDVSWQGRGLAGTYPDYFQVIPAEKSLDWTLKVTDADKLMDFLKKIPDAIIKAVELAPVPQGIRVTSCAFANLKQDFQADTENYHTVMGLDKNILLRLLQQGYTTIRGNTDCCQPVVALGGEGTFVVMPVRKIVHPAEEEKPSTQQEEEKMEENKNVVEQVNPVPVESPVDDLTRAVEVFRTQLKQMLEDSISLSRKAKEVAVMQKQKERDFQQAKRAIERIRMAI